MTHTVHERQPDGMLLATLSSPTAVESAGRHQLSKDKKPAVATIADRAASVTADNLVISDSISSAVFEILGFQCIGVTT